MRRIFRSLLNKKFRHYTRFSIKDYRELEEKYYRDDEMLKRKKLINTEFYDKIKFNKIQGKEEEISEEEETQFNSSIDLLREVEARVLNYINEYSNSKITNITEIPLDIEFSKIGNFLKN